MPLYSWENLKTGEIVEVLRDISEYDVPPKDDEVEGLPEGEWVRLISGNIGVRKTNAWGFGKPNSTNPPISKRVK